MAKNRDLTRTDDFDRETLERLFAAAAKMKDGVKRRQFNRILDGYTAALIFQKPSLRTRMTFDVGINQMGGHAVYLGPSEISMGERESVHDVARNLERWVDIIVARVFAQAQVDELAQVARCPVINALSDDEHPVQVFADFFTLMEHGLQHQDVRLAYIGDGNNVCTSLMIAGATLGAQVRVAAPARYAPNPKIVEKAKTLAERHGGKIAVFEDPREALDGANAVYTDIWTSMGWESEAAERQRVFRPYQINADLMKLAETGAFAMHDLPAHRGEEITDEVMDGPNSIVFDQAENRLHVQKAVILECLGLLDKV